MSSTETKRVRVRCSCGSSPYRPRKRISDPYYRYPINTPECSRCGDTGFYYEDVSISDRFTIKDSDLLSELLNNDGGLESAKEILTSYVRKTGIELPHPIDEYRWIFSRPQFRRSNFAHPNDQFDIQIRDSRYVSPEPIPVINLTIPAK